MRLGVIYVVINLINGKRYIGQTVRDPRTRWNYHSNSSCKLRIGRAIQKYGKENFEFKILLRNVPEFCLDCCEQVLIKLYNTTVTGYNSCIGGASNRGFKLSAEAKLKLAARPISEEFREKHREYARLHPYKHSAESRQKISRANKGKTNSNTAIWNTGRKHSAEEIAKMSRARLGKVPWNKGIPHSEETKAKLSAKTQQRWREHPESFGDRKHSEEAKAKMRGPRGPQKRREPALT